MRIILLLTCCFVLPAKSFSGQSAKQRRPQPEIATINAAMQNFVDAREIAGAVTLVGHQGKIIHLGAVGLADLESGRMMRKSNLFSIASMTKPIVATAVMILQDEGKLSLDDPVSRFLPEFARTRLQDGRAPAREMTLRDCVTHTAGLTGEQIFKSSLAAAVEKLAKRPLAFSPGEKWQYSPGLNVAGRILEIVSQQPLQEFLQARIFDPLGMKHTTFIPRKNQLRRIATLYAKDGDTLKPADSFLGNYSKISAINPSGGLFSTARDMFRFYQMVLNQGTLRRKRIVSTAGIREMISPQTGDLQTGFTPGNCWGLGWCIVRAPQGVTGMLSQDTFGHGGAYGTQGWVDPKTRTIYVLMIQRQGLPNSDGSDIRRSFQLVAAGALK